MPSIRYPFTFVVKIYVANKIQKKKVDDFFCFLKRSILYQMFGTLIQPSIQGALSRYTSLPLHYDKINDLLVYSFA